jgi:hypothetical protein
LLSNRIQHAGVLEGHNGFPDRRKKKTDLPE